MKQVNWQILKPEQIKGSVWDKIDDTKLKLDFKQLEEIFCARAKAPVGGAAGQKPVE